MTIDMGSRGLRFVAEDGAVQIVDVRCGGCAACSAGRDYWCLEERETGDVLAEVARVQDAALVRRWASALAGLSVAQHRRSAALLVLDDVAPDPVTDLVAPWIEGPVIVAADAHDLEMRRRLSLVSATGRAPVVLTVTDVRAAVRAVERGGQVCGPDGGARLPTVTELVQRDVTLLSARGIDSLVTGSAWPLLAAGLSAVLGVPDVARASR